MLIGIFLGIPYIFIVLMKISYVRRKAKMHENWRFFSTGMSFAENAYVCVLRREAVVKLFLPPFGCDSVRPPYVVVDSKLFSMTLSFYFRAIL